MKNGNPINRIKLPAEPSVCLIDGDPAVRDSLRSLAALYGQSVLCYATARAFLEDLSRVSVRCVVCEAQLPDRPGIDVLQALIGRGYRVPFALLVSRDLGRMQAEASDRGIHLVVAKPILDAGLLIEFIGIRSDAIPNPGFSVRMVEGAANDA